MKAEKKDVLKRPVHFIKGVGESRAKLFHKLNIFTLEDVITHFPREYEDRSEIKKIVQLNHGDTCAFEGVVMSQVSEDKPRRGLTLYRVFIKDDTGTIIGTWYNQSYIKNVFCIGEAYIFYGKVTRRYGDFEVQNPVYEKLDGRELKNTCRIVPVYKSTANLAQNTIRTVIRNAILLLGESLEEILPQKVRDTYHLFEINYSIQNIHFPKSDEDFKNARYRLVFEELLLLQLGLLNIKSTFVIKQGGIRFKPVSEIEEFIARLPFKLTQAQTKVFREIEKDMESDKIMNRLVQGDVGSGKTIVAVLALYKAVKSGFQGAFMVPTEILAEQHFRSVNAFMKEYGISVEILTGSQAKKQKMEILNRVFKGQTDILIGTHALIEENVQFYSLGLVITDEQHRFGVRQRSALNLKGKNPDVLVMTATPIPRTLALILYGDLDISIIDELPPGRMAIKTYVVDNTMRERINDFIRKMVVKGHQVFIVCPLVEESDSFDVKSASELSEKIAKHDFNDLRVGLLYGKMKPKDKDAVMNDFINGEINILVSTTVIEVGVNIPNATVMIIENAERFGLAQLHQLRGRVGRGMEQSHCILYCESKTRISAERMKIMKESNDGFLISEKDLQLRGPGEFFGTRQHGIPDLKIANLFTDMNILKEAQEAALDIMRSDKSLSKEENLSMKKKLIDKFQGGLKNI